MERRRVTASRRNPGRWANEHVVMMSWSWECCLGTLRHGNQLGGSLRSPLCWWSSAAISLTINRRYVSIKFLTYRPRDQCEQKHASYGRHRQRVWASLFYFQSKVRCSPVPRYLIKINFLPPFVRYWICTQISNLSQSSIFSLFTKTVNLCSAARRNFISHRRLNVKVYQILDGTKYMDARAGFSFSLLCSVSH